MIQKQPPPCIQFTKLIRQLLDLEIEKNKMNQDYLEILEKIKNTKDDIKSELDKCFTNIDHK
jgi:hypothetical protein